MHMAIQIGGSCPLTAGDLPVRGALAHGALHAAIGGGVAERVHVINDAQALNPFYNKKDRMMGPNSVPLN